ncbi:MAG: hypothetical protein ABW023_04505 [Sphingomonas sp.]
MGKIKNLVIGAVLLAALPTAADAGWKVMAGGQPVAVAKSGMTVTPSSAWNRWSARPSKKGEIWTLDGVALNELSFYAGIAPGEAILKERNKKDKPLPKFSAQMLAPEIVQLFEATSRITLQTSLFEIDGVEPTTFLGKPGVRFTYHYSIQGDELRRNGEARAAVIDGKLYLSNFAAPAIHYFDASIGEVRSIMDSAKL